MCGTEATRLGILGALLHFRCRRCGWEWADLAADHEDDEDPIEIGEYNDYLWDQMRDERDTP